MIVITLVTPLLLVASLPYILTECVDHGDAKTCGIVKRAGYCSKPIWRDECKKSCGVCHAGGGGGGGGGGSGECVDHGDAKTCGIVKRGGYCSQPSWREECKKSCGVCHAGGGGGGGGGGECVDKGSRRRCYWVKRRGYCRREDWREECRKTCGACHGGGGGGGGRVTDPPVSQAPPQGGLAEKCVGYHNDYRRLHQNTPDFEYSNELARSAQAYAEKLMREGSFHHSGTRGVGENLYSSDGYTGDHLKRAFDSWYVEINECPDTCCEGRSGHYTQMVWKSSTKVGCGLAVQGRKVIVVGQYTPAGNFLGRYCENVMPLK